MCFSNVLMVILKEGCGFKTSGDVAQVYKLDSSRHEPLCLAGTAEMSLAGEFVFAVKQTLLCCSGGAETAESFVSSRLNLFY